MGIVFAALLPVFLLIVLGAIPKRTLMRLDTQWHGLERLIGGPASSSAYVLARQMGGDTPLLAQILTLQPSWPR